MRVVATIAAVGIVVGCQPSFDDWNKVEDDFLDLYHATPIGLTGTVVDSTGSPISNAIARIGQLEATTDQSGVFVFDGLARKNALLAVGATEFHTELAVQRLVQPLGVETVDVGTIHLTEARSDTTRFLFTGDVALGRRFLDVDQSTPIDQVPPDDEEALIQASDPGPGSRRIFDYVRPLFDVSDYTIINFESPVTDNPSTPHLEKSFVFYTLPGSIPALKEAGIDFAGLGNNHIFDYLEVGLADTFRHLDAAGLAHGGAGDDITAAFVPYRVNLSGTTYSLHSMCSIGGEQYYKSIVATDEQGGAANLSDTPRVTEAIGSEVTMGNVPIALLHTGLEYVAQVPEYAHDRMSVSVEAGARLVIGHHPHVAQGVELIDDVFTAHSLGNFAFDQARLETMIGMTVSADMRGGEMMGARLIPVYLEDFRPHLIGDDLLAREIRRIGEISPTVQILPTPMGGTIVTGDAEAEVRERSVFVSVDVGDHGFGIADLREVARADESLIAVWPDDDGLVVRVGRDVLRHGDFEDYDSDEEFTEVARWDDDGGSVFPCLHNPHRGAVALCSTRDATNIGDSRMPFRQRVRVMGNAEGMPNKDLTVFGYWRGAKAGSASLSVTYHAASGPEEFGEELLDIAGGGTVDWTPFMVDLDMPPDVDGDPTNLYIHPRAARLRFIHLPPKRGQGLFSIDDVAVINWEPPERTDELSALYANPNDFLRVEAAPGSYRIRVDLRSLRRR